MKTNNIKIKSAFYDSIQSIIESKKILDERKIPKYFQTKEIELDNTSSKQEFLKAFNDCLSFKICNETITFILKRTDKEIEKYLQRQQDSIDYEIEKLKKWCLSSKRENKKQIKEYLEYYSLYFILEKLNNGNYDE